MAHLHAYSFASGEIDFGPSIPDGALPIIDGPDADVHRVIAGCARLSYDGETWLVPGVPEGEGDSRLDALVAFRRRALDRLTHLVEEEGADG
jgi:hypothetical protein